jgi:hypothetical protein
MVRPAMADIHEIRRYFEHWNQRLAKTKQKLKIGIIFVAFLMVYRGITNQDREIRVIRNSISKFYREFEVSMLMDPAEIKDLLGRLKDLSGAILLLDELKEASEAEKTNALTQPNRDYMKTGKFDLASAEIGGKIAGIGDTDLIKPCSAFMKLLNCPGRLTGPENAISSLSPYLFFGFDGPKGSLYVALMAPAIVESVTIEHLPKGMSPTNDVSHAPRLFNVTVS